MQHPWITGRAQKVLSIWSHTVLEELEERQNWESFKASLKALTSYETLSNSDCHCISCLRLICVLIPTCTQVLILRSLREDVLETMELSSEEDKGAGWSLLTPGTLRRRQARGPKETANRSISVP